jgi:hypothetical protein
MNGTLKQPFTPLLSCGYTFTHPMSPTLYPPYAFPTCYDNRLFPASSLEVRDA